MDWLRWTLLTALIVASGYVALALVVAGFTLE